MNGLFDDLPLIAARVKTQVAAFKVVDGLSVVQSFDDVLTQLPGCYIAPVRAKAVDERSYNFTLEEDQHYMLMVCAPSVSTDAVMAEVVLGELALSVIRALHKWSPSVASKGILELKGQRDDVSYGEGFIFQRLLFGIARVIE
ncbi:MAG: hypothetical protein PHU14_09900 [Methylovulum sp.]|nr:hypothetical protein [Methylovulum sp.]